MDYSNLKMYIAVLDDCPDNMVPVVVSHAVLGAHLRSAMVFELEYVGWLHKSYKKCVLRVNRKEFEKIKALSNVYVGNESTVLNGEDICVVVCPRFETPNVLKFAKLWKPSKELDNGN